MSVQVPQGYKQTEVGVIPEDWECQILDELAKRGSGHTPNKKIPEYWNGSIKWISLRDSDALDNLFIEDTATKISKKGLDNSSAVLHSAGTVVLSRDAGVGKSAIMKYEMAVSQHFIAWQCKSNLNNIFLYYYFQSKKTEFERIAMGSTIKTIGLPYFKEFKVPRPSIEEQKAIAETLSDADAMIESLEQLIAKKRQIKQGAMQELLTGQRRLTGFTEEWEIKKISDLADIYKGKGLSKSLISDNGKYRCILYGELFTSYKQFIKEVNSYTNYEEGFSSIEGDVLVPGSTTTEGIDLAIATALPYDDVRLGGDINILRKRHKESFDSIFIAYLLTYTKKKEISDLAQGTTIVHLYGRDLYNLNIRIPSYAEQVSISKYLSDIEEGIEMIGSKLNKAIKIKQAMMQELLTGRIRLI